MTVDLLIVVSTDCSARVLVPLAKACRRAGVAWACFFTNDGVKLLANDEVKNLMGAAVRAIACEYSWERFMGDSPCPVERGSQTDHSALVADTARVVAT